MAGKNRRLNWMPISSQDDLVFRNFGFSVLADPLIERAKMYWREYKEVNR